MEIFGEEPELRRGEAEQADPSGGHLVLDVAGVPRRAHDDASCCRPPDAAAAIFPEDSY